MNPVVCPPITVSSPFTSPAVLTVDGKDKSGYFTNPASVDWSDLPNLQRTVTTTSVDSDTWVFTPKP